LRGVVAKPSQTRIAIRDDASERLVHFMRNRRTYLSERRYASDVGEFRLCSVQCLLRFPGCSDVHQYTNNFLLARFVFHATNSPVKVFDESIRHCHTAFIVAILFALCRAIKFVLHKFAVVLMNTLKN
jgi:hypothetical protein